MNNVTFRKGNYVLHQGDGNPNWHYMIIRDDGIQTPILCACMNCDKKLTPVEANDAIDDYIKCTNGD